MNLKPLLATALAVLTIVGCTKTASSPVATESGAKAEESGHKEGSHQEGAHQEGGSEGEAHGGPIVLSADARKSAGVRSERIAPGSQAAELRVPATIAALPRNLATVTPPVAGQIVRLNVAPGDAVRKGQVLAVVRSPEIAQALAAVVAAQGEVEEASATVERAGAELDLARGRGRTAEQTLARQRAIAGTGLFGAPPVLEARAALNDAEKERQGAVAEDEAHEIVLARAERLFKEGLVSKADVERERLEHDVDHIKVERLRERERIARAGYERERRIAGAGFRTAREVQAAEGEARAANLDTARARIAVRTARAAVESARRRVAASRRSVASLRGGLPGERDFVSLTAPISGVITERSVTLGQAVERSTDLMDIADLTDVDAIASVPEREIVRVSLGASARVAAGDSGPSYSGTVRVVGSALDPRTRTLPIRVLVRGAGGALRPGATADVFLATGARQVVLTVARSAIVREGTTDSVFVEEGGGYEKRAVRLGREFGDRREVLSGVATGDEVVVAGTFTLLSESRKEELAGDED